MLNDIITFDCIVQVFVEQPAVDQMLKNFCVIGK
jgi:hypothetical protein